jgi:putative membrane protein
MFRFPTIAVASIVVLLFGSGPAAAQNAQLSQQDKEFMKKAAMGGKMEIQLGEMAAEKGASEDVTSFGQRMVRDHSEANQKLKTIAQETGVSLPEELDDKHRKTVEKLSGLSGKEFDREYMSAMVKDHDKTIDLFEKQAQQGQHPEVQQFAANTVDTLEEHKRLAKDINQQLSAQAGKKTTSRMAASQLEAGKAKDWIGQTITGQNGEELGTIANNFLSEDGNSVLYVIVRGDSDKMHPLPADLVRQAKEGSGLTADIDKETFDRSPSLTGKPELDNPRWSDEIRSFYEIDQSGKPKQQ